MNMNPTPAETVSRLLETLRQGSVEDPQSSNGGPSGAYPVQQPIPSLALLSGLPMSSDLIQQVRQEFRTQSAHTIHPDSASMSHSMRHTSRRPQPTMPLRQSLVNSSGDLDVDAVKRSPWIKDLTRKLMHEQEYVEEKLFQKRSALQEKLARSSSPKEVKKMELLEFDRFLLHEMDKLRITQQEAFERAGLPMFRVTRDLLEIERQKRTLSLLISAVHQ